MKKIKLVDTRRLNEFIELKNKASLSTSALANRAGVSLNTVKAYLDPKRTVRDTTEQKLWEALNSYISEQAQVLQETANVKRLGPDTRSANDVLRAALKCHNDFLSELKRAMETANRNAENLDQNILNDIKISRASVQGLFDLAAEMAGQKSAK